jgi:hypothetical protein
MAKLVAERKEPVTRQKPAPNHPLTVQQLQNLAKQDADAIPVLLAESDAALNQAQLLQAQAQATKDRKVQKSIAEYAKKAQSLADQKAQELLARKRDMDLRLATIGQLETAGSSRATDKHADRTYKGKSKHRSRKHQDDSSDDR